MFQVLGIKEPLLLIHVQSSFHSDEFSYPPTPFWDNAVFYEDSQELVGYDTPLWNALYSDDSK